MVEYRTFHNCDPPEILKLWHTGDLGPSAAEGFPCDILELFVFSQPFFDRKGVILAFEGDQLVGFIHAGFKAASDASKLDRSQGIVAAVLVHPEHRRKKIGSELIRHAEKYLTSQGAKTISVGGGLDSNGFYNGLYGGMQSSGFSHTAAAWNNFLEPLGYTAGNSTTVMHRDLTIGRDPVSSRLIRHRRRLNLTITDRVSELDWWWHVRFGHLDALQFQLQQRHDNSIVASGQIVGLDVYIPKWGVRAVGLRDVNVPEEHRRHGYGLSLVLEICKRLREQSIQLIEAQLDSANAGAYELFSSSGFEKVQELVTFERTL